MACLRARNSYLLSIGKWGFHTCSHLDGGCAVKATMARTTMVKTRDRDGELHLTHVARLNRTASTTRARLLLFHSLEYVVPINQLTDDGAGRGCLQALGVLFPDGNRNKVLGHARAKVLFRMCHPNINVRRVSMIRLTKTTSSKSLTSAIMCDTSKTLAQVPNLDAHISVLPYQITT
jgi:hypothetical protein